MNETMPHHKTKPDDLTPTQLTISVSIDVEMPDITAPTIEATIEVPGRRLSSRLPKRRVS